jgi:putative peptidoglycan lipid II flippase
VAILAAAIGQVASSSADAFALANQLPNSIYALVGGGILGAVLVPQIVRSRRHDDGGAGFINRIVTLGIVIFAAVAVIATLAAPALVSLYVQSSDDGRGFTPEALALATAFAYWCLPQIFFYGLYSVLSEVLNARNRFGPFTWAPVLNNVVAIAGLAAFMVIFGQAENNDIVAVWGPDRIGLLAGTATGGVVAQALILWLFWRRAGLRYRPDFHWRGVGLARTGKTAAWLFGIVLIAQIGGIVQSRVTSIGSAEGASISALQNSWLIFMLPHSVVAVSIATAYFTRMSAHAARGDLGALRSDTSASLRAIGLVIVFATVALAVVAYPFARVFETDFANVQAMGNVILAFLPGLIVYSALFIVQRVLYALNDMRTSFGMQCVQTTVFIGGALACTALPAEWIGVGIAVVTSISSTVQTVLGVVLVRRRLNGVDGRLVLKRHLQYLAVSIVAGAVGLAVVILLGGFSADGFAQAGKFEAIVSMIVAGSLMAVAYGGGLLMLRNPELGAVRAAITARLRARNAE